MNQVGTDNAYASQYNDQSKDSYAQLFPFLKDEMTDPQGFGNKALTDIRTSGGEATSGALGAGDEQATLAASRTGNTASLPGVIDANSRNAMKQQSNNFLTTDIANEQEKEQQRQSGAAGMGGLYGTDTNAALKSLGLADQSIDEWTKGKQAADQNVFDWTKLGVQAAGTAAGGM